MKNNILITGTVAFDDIETPFGKSGTIVGGAATYIGLAASFFSKKLAIVSVIGEDFPIEEITFLNERNINTDMIQIIKGGKTFYWKGKYHKNMVSRDTISTELNVLENFKTNVYQTFFGSDIIDLNSIVGKVMASTVYQPSTIEIVKKLLNENHFIRSYTIQSKNLRATFRELEAHFQKQNQILLGYIDYDYTNFIDGGERKIRKIGINPNQREVIKLNIGDRLITLSHY